jgi:hypothetical protein
MGFPILGWAGQMSEAADRPAGGWMKIYRPSADRYGATFWVLSFGALT